jgi:hypothetical protein
VELPGIDSLTPVIPKEPPETVQLVTLLPEKVKVTDVGGVGGVIVDEAGVIAQVDDAFGVMEVPEKSIQPRTLPPQAQRPVLTPEAGS